MAKEKTKKVLKSETALKKTVKTTDAAAKKTPAKKTPAKKTDTKINSKEPKKKATEVTPKKPLKSESVKTTATKPTKEKIEKPKVAIKESSKPSKKQVANVGIQYVEADKNYLKQKVKTMLISQPKPENEKSPFVELARQNNIKINFRQFIQIEPVSAKDFRQQRVNLPDYHAVILTSRIAIDHYFRVCNEMRYTVPENTKYFCLTESIALYLQKYVQYRKRKIFYGQQTINDLVDVIKKHREENYILPVSDVHREKIADFLDELKINYTKATFYKTVCADLSDFNGKLDYDVLVFFTPMGINSLFKNFPKFKQGETRIAAFGYATCQAVKENKLRLDIAAPSKETPSMASALEKYIKEVNKR